MSLATCLLLGVSASHLPFPDDAPSSLLNAPAVVQSTSYSCGAAALQSALGYYGIDEDNESDLMKALGTNEDFGTKIENMADYARKKGIKSKVARKQTLEDLRRHFAQKQLSIVEVQAWADEEGTVDYTNRWEDGHYMVVIGLDHENIYFMDPSMQGSRGFLPLKEFLARWHDLSSEEEKLHYTALYLWGSPKPPPPVSYVP